MRRPQVPTHWRADDPTPPVGTQLQTGGPQDKVTVTLEASGWTYAHNNDTARPGGPGTAWFWASPSPMRVLRWGDTVLRFNGNAAPAEDTDEDTDDAPRCYQ